MRTETGCLRRQYALVALAVGVLAIAIWGFHPRAAHADGGPSMPDRAYSAGPFLLQDGERVLIGMLLPAVQRVREAASFVILDSSGKPVFRAQPPGPPQTNGNASFFSSFFDITYRVGSPANPNGGRFEIHAKGTPGGGDIGSMVTVPSADGILIGLLLPAIQHNGKTAPPLATSMQSFNANGGTMTHSFFDVSFDVFMKPPNPN